MSVEEAEKNLDWTNWKSVLTMAEEIAAEGRWSPDVGSVFTKQAFMAEIMSDKKSLELDAAVERGWARARRVKRGGGQATRSATGRSHGSGGVVT